MKAIRGGLHDYCEVFPDEGVVDFVKVIRILRDTGFSGSICPDHMPNIQTIPVVFKRTHMDMDISKA